MNLLKRIFKKLVKTLESISMILSKLYRLIYKKENPPKVKALLKSLENWEENYETKKYENAQESELSRIVSMQKNKDIDDLLKLWRKKISQEYFELPHPEHPNVTTKAVYNIQEGMANYILMLDKDNLHPWIAVQSVYMIDIAIVENKIFDMSPFKNKTILPNISKLSTLDTDLRYSDKKFGILLNQKRPYHFFYDQLKFLYFLKEDRLDIHQKGAFFRIKHPSVNTTKPKKREVFLFPTAIENNTLDQSNNITVKRLNETMEKRVHEDAMRGYTPVAPTDNRLKVWYGITGQKRSWLEQVDGCIEIVAQLLKHFKNIELIVDGMTATEGEILNNREDESVLKEIESRIDKRCRVESLIGQDYRTKIRSCSSIDLFIANAGTGCMVPLRFCKKPGVLHSNSKLFTFTDDYPKTVKVFDEKYVVDIYDEKRPRVDFASYHIPWQHIFNLTAEVVNLTKGMNIKTLKVPSPDNRVQEDNKRDEEHSIFEDIEKRMKPTYESPDILREVALSFEESGDIKTALAIMQQAQTMRPTGTLINKKVEEYKKLTESDGALRE
ncbi:MAG: hypothetical protein U9N39_09265 [Campylobacterota bacterium]|nr:hypothetical protein [Campylobacterota bacterium]